MQPGNDNCVHGIETIPQGKAFTDATAVFINEKTSIEKL